MADSIVGTIPRRLWLWLFKHQALPHAVREDAGDEGPAAPTDAKHKEEPSTNGPESSKVVLVVVVLVSVLGSGVTFSLRVTDLLRT